MLDDQLAASLEKIGQRLLALRRVKEVLVFDFQPGQHTPFGGDQVT
jgi:hypothetical protein